VRTVNTVKFEERPADTSAVIIKGNLYRSHISGKVHLGCVGGQLIDLVDAHIFNPSGEYTEVHGTLTVTAP
jgi:hypothetical protein